ncbi:MAG: TRAP transporter large permease subunit [Syntrophaceae bacterium]|nr:TRAP transporter large permease subunit [Syntrophaceae bacterium]
MDINPLWMFLPTILFILAGIPLGAVLGGVATIFGLIFWGPQIVYMFAHRIYALQINYLLIAIPLFIFMGNMLGRSGVAEKLYGAMHIWMGPIRGGLAIGTVFLCTIFAAATGIIGASVTSMGILALPEMLKRDYDIELSAGVIMAAGTLGILIPPSIMLVVYGSWAMLSVGKLFMAAVFPGLMLSGMYAAYVVIRCWLNPELGPPLPKEERGVPMRQKVVMLATSIAPPIFLILAVLGTIFFGVATPTEASALGAIGSIIIAAANKKLNWQLMKETLYSTGKTIGMICIIAAGASCFTSVFLGIGGGGVVEELLLSIPFGKWGALVIIMLIMFVLGAFLDYFGILMIFLPILSPIIVKLGFDPIWFATMVVVNMQMSFLTPPYGMALFFLKGVAPDEVTMAHLMRSVVPFLGIIILCLVLIAVFPGIASWLPNIMIK